MLMPKKVKYRKQQRGRMRGLAWRGSTVAFGDYGLMALEPCWMTDRQIEAARVALSRGIKRGVVADATRQGRGLSAAGNTCPRAAAGTGLDPSALQQSERARHRPHRRDRHHRRSGLRPRAVQGA